MDDDNTENKTYEVFNKIKKGDVFNCLKNQYDFPNKKTNQNALMLSEEYFCKYSNQTPKQVNYCISDIKIEKYIDEIKSAANQEVKSISSSIKSSIYLAPSQMKKN